MKIRVEFVSALPPEPGAKLLQLLPGSRWNMDDLESYAKAWDVALITPVFSREGQQVMACVTKDGWTYQPMCFPNEREGIPGEDIYPVAFSWGKLALCCAEDVFQPQYARLAALKGCCLMTVCFPWEERALCMAGPWSVCQANCLPVALAQPWGGQLILPCPITEDGSGFGRDVFDTEELAKAYRAFPVFDSLNGDFYTRFRKELES